jgi:type VI secretion system secreted protein Hcp
MATDFFLKIDNVQGESQDDKHKDEIDISSWSFGSSNPTTVGSGSGSGGGKVSISDLHIQKVYDKSSAALAKKCGEGQHFDKAVLTCRKAGGSQVEYIVYTFEQVFITSLNWGSANGQGEVSESVTLSFGSYVAEYKMQTAKGELSGSTRGGWDVRSNKSKS